MLKVSNKNSLIGHISGATSFVILLDGHLASIGDDTIKIWQ